MAGNPKFSGFHKKLIPERQDLVFQHSGLDAGTAAALDSGGIDLATADRMVENVIGLYALPFGIATNFLVNGREVLVPMVIEEPSVVAGASFMAKLVRDGGGFAAEADEAQMIGQIQLLDVPDPQAARAAVLAHAADLLAAAEAADPVLKKAGGGPREVEARVLDHPAIGAFLVVHLLIDVRDAMGANAVNTACERIAPLLERITGGRAHAAHPFQPGGPAPGARPLHDPGGVAGIRRLDAASGCGTASWRRRLSRRPIRTAPPRTTRAS